jgi:hypothetical protein
MSTVTAILHVQPDGTLHLPLPAELRHGKVEVVATLTAVNDSAPNYPRATPEMIRHRKEALKKLRESGGLADIVSDPATWQREERRDRPLPEIN